MKQHYNIPIFLPHAACPFRCVFCDQYLITSQLEIPSPSQVEDTIRETLSTIPESAYVETAFFGGNFTALPREQQEAYLQTVQPWLTSGRIQNIRISTRPDCIDDEILSWLKHYGVQVVELGIQSFDEAVLRASGRGYTSEQAVRACQAVKKAGLRLGVQLMPGLPQDTFATSIASAHMTVQVQADMVRIYPTVVLKGTPLAAMMEKKTYQALPLEAAIEVAKEMKLIFEASQIPVIRLGLYVGEDLQQEENVCGGAFHPALGELVEQRIFLEQTEGLLQKANINDEAVTLYINQRDRSKWMGWKRENWLKLTQKYAKIQVQSVESEEKNWVGLGWGSAAPEVIWRRTDFLQWRFDQENE